jgi:hypothetical protein
MTVGPLLMEPLGVVEKQLAAQVAGSAETDLGSRNAALILEVIAHLLTGLVFEYRDHPDADAIHGQVLMQIVARVNGIASEHNELACAVLAKQRDERP